MTIDAQEIADAKAPPYDLDSTRAGQPAATRWRRFALVAAALLCISAGAWAFAGGAEEEPVTATLGAQPAKQEFRGFSAVLPEGFEFVDESEGQYEGYDMVNGASEPSGESWPTYTVRLARGGLDALEANPETTPVIAVTVTRGEIYTKDELRATKEADKATGRKSQDATVRGGKPALHVNSGVGWLAVEWSEKKKLGYAVTGLNVSLEQLRAVAESIREETK